MDEQVGVPMKHQAVVLGACFSSDSKRLLTHSAEKTIRLWDVATCLPLMAPMQHNDAVMNAGFHPSGELAISNRLWRFPRPLPDCPI